MHCTEIFADFVFKIKAHNSKYRDFKNIHYIQAHSSQNFDPPNMFPNYYWVSVAYPGILFRWGGSTNSVEDRGQREWGSGGGSPLVRGSGGSCNLVQEISFYIVKFSKFLVL